jgi:hypothetical protein
MASHQLPPSEPIRREMSFERLDPDWLAQG